MLEIAFTVNYQTELIWTIAGHKTDRLYPWHNTIAHNPHTP